VVREMQIELGNGGGNTNRIGETMGKIQVEMGKRRGNLYRDLERVGENANRGGKTIGEMQIEVGKCK
jgi:hypothetical protein